MTSATSDPFGDFVEALRTSTLNLVSARDRERLHDRHLPEARAFARGLPPARAIWDIGSGGGIPGMVIAIERPEAKVTLVESRRRKAEWLEATAAALGLDNVQVIAQRAEDARVAPPPDVVTARAVAPLDRLVGYVHHLVGPATTFHAIKGERWQAELDAARGAIERAGLRVTATPTDPGRTGMLSTAPTGSDDPHPLVIILQRGSPLPD